MTTTETVLDREVAEVPAADTPLGRVAVLRGPSRERFALLDATEED